MNAQFLGVGLFTECGFPRNVVIRKNTIVGVGQLPMWWSGYPIDVNTFSHRRDVARVTAGNHADIRIEDNVIIDTVRDGIYARGVTGLVVRGNRISKVGHRSFPRQRAGRGPRAPETPVAIRIENCRNVIEADNKITDTAAPSAKVIVAE